jgi:hypothetical protein
VQVFQVVNTINLFVSPVPIVIVFTQYDVLVTHCTREYRDDHQGASEDTCRAEGKREAKRLSETFTGWIKGIAPHVFTSGLSHY